MHQAESARAVKTGMGMSVAHLPRRPVAAGGGARACLGVGTHAFILATRCHMQRGLILLVVAALAACDRGTEPVGPNASAGGASYQLSAVSADPTPDQMAVAQAVPGFGGYFIDAGGAPAVYLTDPSQRPAAEVALAGFLA